MADDEARRPLKERIEEKVRGLLDDLVEALDSLLTPEPQLVPIPIRRPHRRR